MAKIAENRKSILKQWANETSFHGIKDIKDSEFTIIKFCWAFVLFGATFYFCYQTHSLIVTFINDPIAVQITYESFTKQKLEDQNIRIVYCPSDWIEVEKVKKFPELQNKLFFAFLLSHLDTAELFASFDTGVQFYHVDHWVRHLLGIEYKKKIRYEKLFAALKNRTEEWFGFQHQMKPFLQRYNFTDLKQFFISISANHGGEADGKISTPEMKLFRYGRVCGVYPSDPQIDYMFGADGRADFARYFFHNISNQPPGAPDVDIIISMNPSTTYRVNRVAEAGRPSDMLIKPFRIPLNAINGVSTELFVDIRHEERVAHGGRLCKEVNRTWDKYHSGSYTRQCLFECAEDTARKEKFCLMQNKCEDFYGPGKSLCENICPFWGPVYQQLFNL